MRIFCKTKCDNLGVERIDCGASEWTGRSFEECDAVVFIGAVGIGVRYIAPYIRSKTEDPAVVAMDEHARWTIALLAGHIGGSNELTARIAGRLGSEAVITTATDLNGKFSVDTFAARNGLRMCGMKLAQEVSVRVLDGGFVGFCSDIPVEGRFPDGITAAEKGEFGVCVSTDPSKKPFGTTFNLVPMDTVLGVGCKRGTDPAKLRSFAEDELGALGMDPKRVRAVASVDLKKDEEAVLELGRALKAETLFYSAEELGALPGEFSGSEFVASVTGVDCVCERAAVAAGGEAFALRKKARDGMTLAVATRKVEPRFL